MTKNKKQEWNSNLAFMMAMIGSAVGLGNIWRFPNVLYSHGGGSFMIPYIISLFLLGISFVLVEYAVGFKFKKSIARILFSIKTKLEPVAWFILLIVFLITTYYVCVVGWDLIYIVLSFTKAWGSNPDIYFANNVLHSTDSISGIFTIVPNVLISIFIIWLIAWLIIKRDLNDGIGRVSQILLPLLCLIVVGIVAFSLTLPGASEGYTQIFTPDWSALTNLDVWLAAFGQIVFSLSLGMAIAMTYASYLPEDSKLVDNALIVAFSNSGFEIFNSIGIFSILGFMSVTSGTPMVELVSEGTGLIFVVFPKIFDMMGIVGHILAPLFFLAVLFAGISSAFAFFEPIVGSISAKFNITRKRLVTILCIIGCACSLLLTCGISSYLVGIIDAFVNEFGILLLVAVQCIIFGWYYGAEKLIPIINRQSSIKIGKLWKNIIKYILPVFIFIIWIIGIITLFMNAKRFEVIVDIGIILLVLIFSAIFYKIKAPANQ